MQTFLLVPLLLDWIVPLTSSRNLAIDTVEAALQRLDWLSRGPKEGDDAAKDLSRHRLFRLVQTIVLLEPGVLVAPRWKYTCENIVEQVFSFPPSETLTEEVKLGCVHSLRTYEKAIKRRNLDLNLKENIPPTDLERWLEALDTPWDRIPVNERYRLLFPSSGNPGTGDPVSLESQKDIVACICEWAITTERFGDFRPYLAAELLRLRLADEGDAECMQGILSDFLESHVSASEAEERSLLFLFGELDRCRVFSYGMFLQRLVARGCFSKAASSRGRPNRGAVLLQSLPLAEPTSYILNQRGSLLDRTWAASSEETYQQLESSIGAAIFSETPLAAVMDGLGALDRYTQVRLGRWLASVARSIVEQNGTIDETQLCAVLGALESLKDYSSLWSVCRLLLFTAHTPHSLIIATDCLAAHLDIFSGFGNLDEAFVSLSMKEQERVSNRVFLDWQGKADEELFMSDSNGARTLTGARKGHWSQFCNGSRSLLGVPMCSEPLRKNFSQCRESLQQTRSPMLASPTGSFRNSADVSGLRKVPRRAWMLQCQ